MSEITFEKTDSLVKIVSALCKVVPVRSVKPEANFIYFAKGKLMATNLDVTMEIHLPDLDGEVDKPFAVHAQGLKNATSLCGPSLRIMHSDADGCTVRSGKDEFDVPCLKEHALFEGLNIQNKDTYRLKCSFADFAGLLNYCTPHVANEIQRKLGLDGVHLLSNGAHLRACGGDGHTLAWSFLDATEDVDVSEYPNKEEIKLLSGGMIIPRETAHAIKDLSPTYDSFGCEFSCDGSKWTLELKHAKGTGKLCMSGSIIDLPFPKISKVIIRKEEAYNAEQVLYVSTELFKEKVKKVSEFSGDDTKCIKFDISKADNTIRMSCFGKGKASVFIPMDKLSFAIDDFTIEADPSLILKCLGSIRTENVQLRCDPSRIFILDDKEPPNPSTGMVLSTITRKKAV